MSDELVQVVRKSTGAAGPKGDAGATGQSGPPGMDGLDGEEGASGIPGPVGPTGATGSTGITGAQGVATYLVGEDGEPGLDGIAGAQGPAGPTGSIGPTGPAVFLVGEEIEGDVGPQGVQGFTGAQGPVGPAIFLVGDDGEQGDVGPALVPNKPLAPNAYTTDVPITYSDEGTFSVNDTGYLTQRSQLAATATEHVVFAGTGRMWLSDPDPFMQGTNAPTSYTLPPDEYILQYKQLSLRGTVRVTLLSTAQIILTSLTPMGRIVLAGSGGGT